MENTYAVKKSGQTSEKHHTTDLMALISVGLTKIACQPNHKCPRYEYDQSDQKGFFDPAAA
jgi:hypothetical protein